MEPTPVEMRAVSVTVPQRLAVVDVHGTRVVFWLWMFDSPASPIREAYGVFDSLRLP